MVQLIRDTKMNALSYHNATHCSPWITKFTFFNLTIKDRINYFANPYHVGIDWFNITTSLHTQILLENIFQEPEQKQIKSQSTFSSGIFKPSCSSSPVILQNLCSNSRCEEFTHEIMLLLKNEIWKYLSVEKCLDALSVNINELWMVEFTSSCITCTVVCDVEWNKDLPVYYYPRTQFTQRPARGMGNCKDSSGASQHFYKKKRISTKRIKLNSVVVG